MRSPDRSFFAGLGSPMAQEAPNPTSTDSFDLSLTQSAAIAMVAERCGKIRTVTILHRSRHVLIHDG
ncbi:hypothetical protein JCM18916_2352 [Cutibacterium acnes JCM 18916]|nr:hypothetical protein JCM18916_2352 [Cutibacterium acnes JCM 18916]GAE76460.1 hypothetical protein JCM18918_2256 [Cutibacterium acnes JCM 18918]